MNETWSLLIITVAAISGLCQPSIEAHHEIVFNAALVDYNDSVGSER